MPAARKSTRSRRRPTGRPSAQQEWYKDPRTGRMRPKPRKRPKVRSIGRSAIRGRNSAGSTRKRR